MLQFRRALFLQISKLNCTKGIDFDKFYKKTSDTHFFVSLEK